MNAASPSPQLRLIVLVGAFAGGWALLILAFAAQLVFTASFDWSRALLASFHDWLPWALLSPAVIWLTRRFPFEAGGLGSAIPVHLVACAVAVVLSGWVSNNLIPRPIGPGFAQREGPGAGPFRGAPGGPGMRPGLGPRRDFWGVVLWNRARFNLPVYFVLVAGTQAFLLYRRVQERDRRALELSASLSQAKLQALRLQLQPHFLFNTLNAIATLVHRDPDRADELIVDLSELLRLSLEVGEPEIPLRRELEILDRYLQIEQVRLGDRLGIRREIEPEALEALVPTLMLQTIVENAVRHGIEPRSEPGTVTLLARRRGDFLVLIVRDDGVGLGVADRAAGRRGIGLSNTESRLAELHGAAARVELRAPPAGGVEVEIVLPFRPAVPPASVS